MVNMAYNNHVCNS